MGEVELGGLSFWSISLRRSSSSSEEDDSLSIDRTSREETTKFANLSLSSLSLSLSFNRVTM